MSSPVSDRRRLLGFAFANADFLVEIDAGGAILYLTGAAAKFTATPDLVGKPLRDLFDADDGARFADKIRHLPPASRSTMRLKLRRRGEATVSLFRLPDNDNRISCALSLPDVHAVEPAETVDRRTGLVLRDSFVKAAAKSSETDALTLVSLPRLPQLCAEMPSEKADALLAAIGQSLIDGTKMAGRLSESSFGTVADAATGPKTKIPAMRAAMSRNGVADAEIHESRLSMKSAYLKPEQRLLAVRHVVDCYASGRRQTRAVSNVSDAFEAMLDETQDRLSHLIDSVAAGDFALAYQPLANLKTGEVSHYEALARFAPGETAETVEFMEKLGIANTFDLAVALKVITAIEADTSHGADVAFNVSGQTIQSPSGFGMLASLLARHKKLAPRLLVEITETAAITDTESAAGAIEALRKMGLRVGLDDFGSGAATLNYLHAFTVDFVKFDGSLVKKIGTSARNDKMINSVLKLCQELGVITVAECIETQADLAKVKKCGFTLGQGYMLGVPGAIAAGTGFVRRAAHRKGLRETWE